MKNALIGWQNEITGATLTASSAEATMAAENLQNDIGSPASAWQTVTGTVSASLLIDSGSLETTWRVFLLGRTNLTTAATVRWRVGSLEGFMEQTPLFELPYAVGATPPPGYHFSRASEGSYFDATGVLQQAPADTLRLTHDPATLEFQGALKEESRTNQIRNPRCEGAGGGSMPTFWPAVLATSGLTATVVGVSVENGISCVVVRCQGTTTASGASFIIAFEAPTQIAAVTGQTWTLSAFGRLIAGSFGTPSNGPWLQIVEANSSGAYVTGGNVVFAPTSAPLRAQRAAYTRTLSGGATVAAVQPGFRVVYPAGVSVDFTVSLGFPQMEQGGCASSVILPPAGSPGVSTRANDSEYVDGLALDGAVGFTVFADWTAAADGSNPIAWSLTPASAAFVDSYYLQQLTLSANLNVLDSVHGNWASRGLGAVAGQRNRVAAMMSLPSGSQVFAQYAVPPPPGGPVGGGSPINGPGLPGVYVRLGCASGSWGAGAPNMSGVQTWRRLAVYGPLYAPMVGALAYYGSTILPQFVTYDSGVVQAGVEPGFGQSVMAAPAPAAGRYCLLEIDDPTNPDGFLNIPLAFAGPAWQPTGNVSPSTVQGRDDATAEFTSRSGQEYPVSFWQRRRADVDFQAIRNDEVWPNVDALDRAARRGGNCLFIPDPDSADRHRAAVFGRAKPRADLSYYQGAPDRRAWRVMFTERL